MINTENGSYVIGILVRLLGCVDNKAEKRFYFLQE
jgi:hypothetical protein